MMPSENTSNAILTLLAQQFVVSPPALSPEALISNFGPRIRRGAFSTGTLIFGETFIRGLLYLMFYDIVNPETALRRLPNSPTSQYDHIHLNTKTEQ